MSRITIKDLAKKLNVNISTISRGLRKQKEISLEMQNKIENLAVKLGYRPNQVAINFRKRKINTIAIILPSLSTFFSTSVISAVEEFAHTLGVNLLIFHSNDNLQREIENVNLCLENGVDGVLISLSNETKDIEHIAELLYAKIPVILYDKIAEPSLIHKVVFNDSQGAEKGTIELLNQIQSFDKKILGIFADENMSITQKRKAGFLSVLKKNQIKNVTIIQTNNHSILFNELEKIWQNKKDFNGVFIMSDDLLLATNRYLTKKSFLINTDFKLMCMSDGYFIKYLYPPLNYVETSGYKIGKCAVELLFKIIKDKSLIDAPETILLEAPILQQNLYEY